MVLNIILKAGYNQISNFTRIWTLWILVVTLTPVSGARQPLAPTKTRPMRITAAFTTSTYTVAQPTPTRCPITCADPGSLPVASYTPTPRPWWGLPPRETGPVPWKDFLWPGKTPSSPTTKSPECIWRWSKKLQFCRNQVHLSCWFHRRSKRASQVETTCKMMNI